MKKMFSPSIFILFLFSGCYQYYKEVNNKGICEIKYRKTLFEKCESSYAADGVLVKNIDVTLFQDTISKRCFSSIELERLKKTLLKDSLLAKRPFAVEIFNIIDLEKCIGLFIINFDNIFLDKNRYISIPLLKLQDTIFINGIQDVEMNPQIENYIKEKLLNSFDSTEVEHRIDFLKRGKQIKFYRPGRPTRFRTY